MPTNGCRPCADHLHYPSGKPKEMRGETSETLAMGGGHAHCGTLVYLGDSFPASYRNTVFLCNIHGRRINNDLLLRRKGSGYTASHGKDFMIAGDPWFMGVTLRTGPDGSVFVSDWSDTGECHTYKPDTTTGRIYKISLRQAGQDPGGPDPAERRRAGEAPAASQRLVRPPRPPAAAGTGRESPGWQRQPVHAALRKMLASPQLDVPQRLRALWALHVTGGLDAARLLALLDDRSEHVRAWSIQLLCEGPVPGDPVLGKFREMAKSDPSPVVRLYLAAALQRLPLPARWGIAEGLLSHAEDAGDANLPLMDWYGIEPLVPADPARWRCGWRWQRGFPWSGSSSPAGSPMRRCRRESKGDLTPLVAALAAIERDGAARPAPRGARGPARPQEHEDAGRLARSLCPPGPQRQCRDPGARHHAGTGAGAERGGSGASSIMTG